MSIKSLHIIYLSFYAFPGRGTHTIQIINTCSAFSRIPGIKITLVTPRQSDSRLDSMKSDLWNFYGIEDTFKIHFTPDRFNLRNKNKLLIKFYRTVLSFGTFINFISKQKEDFIIYTRAPRIIGLLSFLVKVLRVKNFKGFFVELHTLPKNLSPLKKAKGFVVISNSLKNDLKLSEENVLVAHDGVNLNGNKITETTEQVRCRLGLPLKKKIITYTGKIINQKGANNLIEAFASLNGRNDIFLLLVGKIYNSYHKNLAEKLKIRNIKFTGFVQPSEVSEYLYCSDILVLPSTQELAYAKYTSPLKLFEYMAAQKIIIASALESITEVLKHEKSGLLYDPDNPEELTKLLIYVLDNNKQAEKLAKSAFNEVVNYSWDIRAKKIVEFICCKVK